MVTVDLPEGMAAGLVPAWYAAEFRLLPDRCRRRMRETSIYFPRRP
jgi:hypothetical protein